MDVVTRLREHSERYVTDGIMTAPVLGAGRISVIINLRNDYMDLYPDIFNVSIIDRITNEPINNIAIKITLFATRKNNYHFIPSISNENGYIKILKEWLNSEIEKEMNLFIMDYSCRLSDCLPKLEILVMSEEDIKKAVNGMNLFKDYFMYSDQDIVNLSNVANKQYKAISNVIALSGEKTVDIKLELERVG